MTPLIEFCFWIFVLSSTLTYAWWTVIRVGLLRQDLFNIRDGLLASAEKSGMVNDPAYVETREKINNMIRFAPLLSFAVLVWVLFSDGGRVGGRIRYPACVSHARYEVTKRLMSYMLYESIIGLFLCVLAMIYGFNLLIQRQVEKWLERLFDSHRSTCAFA